MSPERKDLVRMLIIGIAAAVVGTFLSLQIDWFPTQGATAAEKIDTLDAWLARHRAIVRSYEEPIMAAIAAGAGTDRLAWAFGSGYQCAGRKLVPTMDPQRLGALCATEMGGAHPRAIETKLVDTRVVIEASPSRSRKYPPTRTARLARPGVARSPWCARSRPNARRTAWP